MTQAGSDQIDDKIEVSCQPRVHSAHTSYWLSVRTLKHPQSILLICCFTCHIPWALHCTCMKSRHWDGYLAITKCPQQLSRLLIENLPYSIYVQSKSCRRIQILVNTRSRNIYIYFVFVWILKLHSVFSHWTGIFARIFWIKMCYEIFPLKIPVWRNLQDLKDFRGIFNIVGSENQLVEQSPEKVKGQTAGLNWSIDNICRGSTLIFKHWPRIVTFNQFCNVKLVHVVIRHWADIFRNILVCRTKNTKDIQKIGNILINIYDPIESYLAGWWIVLFLLINSVALSTGDD